MNADKLIAYEIHVSLVFKNPTLIAWGFVFAIHSSPSLSDSIQVDIQIMPAIDNPTITPLIKAWKLMLIV